MGRVTILAAFGILFLGKNLLNRSHFTNPSETPRSKGWGVRSHCARVATADEEGERRGEVRMKDRKKAKSVPQSNGMKRHNVIKRAKEESCKRTEGMEEFFERKNVGAVVGEFEDVPKVFFRRRS
jgi:hypothetical protein